LNLLDPAVDIARAAGDVIAEIYERDFSASEKSDGSPVTEADLAANDLIVAALAKLSPEIAIVSEEGSPSAAGAAAETGTLETGRFWLVDPLDGTKDFLKRNDEFCVCIALIENGYPVLGVIHAPASGRTYAGAGAGTATLAERGEPALPISCRAPSTDGLVQAVSRSRPDECNVTEYAPDVVLKDRIVSGSALKFALVAAGQADVYANLGGSCEWDTGAGQALIEAAGGTVTTLEGARLIYGKPTFRNPTFIAAGLGADSWLPAVSLTR
jgi:3'(2'), 5'-bisphosphate nucleotidase